MIKEYDRNDSGYVTFILFSKERKRTLRIEIHRPNKDKYAMKNVCVDVCEVACVHNVATILYTFNDYFHAYII